MTQRASRFTLSAAATVLLALPALAQTTNAADDRIPITDPWLLERMGFAPDATNVYATAQALMQLETHPATDSGTEEAGSEVDARSPFGTLTNGYTSVTGSAFVPLDSDTGYASFSGSNRYCTAGGPFFEADLEDIPHGARLSVVRAWYYDDSSEDLEVFLFRTCYPDFDAGTPDITTLGSTSSTGTGGWKSTSFFLAAADRDIDRQSCSYTVRARLDAGILSCSEGTNLRIGRARGEWRRQVSPAPGTATFDDVPTGHLFFQHIEALAAAGITGGCDADSYCPNAPLTRGQMAVFLATALGLHWGSF